MAFKELWLVHGPKPPICKEHKCRHYVLLREGVWTCEALIWGPYCYAFKENKYSDGTGGRGN